MIKLNEKSSLLDCQRHYVDDCLARGQSPSTGETNRVLLGCFIDWCFPQEIVEIGQLNLDLLESYRAYLYRWRKSCNGEPLSVSTQRMRLMAITGLLKRLYNLNKLESDFYKGFELPRVKKNKLLDIPSEKEMTLIIAQTATKGKMAVRDKAIMELYYASGMRRAELANLDIRDIDYQEQVVKVRKGKGGVDRVIPIAPRTLATITIYMNELRPEMATIESGVALFLGMTGKRIQNSALTDLVGSYIRRSGVSDKGACHVLRHASATHMLRNGADIRYIQDFLGHEHIVSTQIYTHVYQEDLKRVYSQTHPAYRG
jgi:integrase/recombinase XerD